MENDPRPAERPRLRDVSTCEEDVGVDYKHSLVMSGVLDHKIEIVLVCKFDSCLNITDILGSHRVVGNYASS